MKPYRAPTAIRAALTASVDTSSRVWNPSGYLGSTNHGMMHESNHPPIENFSHFLEQIDALSLISDDQERVRRLVILLGRARLAHNLDPSWLITSPQGYLRKQLHQSAKHGYEVLLLTWGPGQGSGVHDHGGAWGGEVVLTGSLTVTEYQPAALAEDAELGAGAVSVLAAGKAIGLLPGNDVHRCQNLGLTTTLSLHVYGEKSRPVQNYRFR